MYSETIVGALTHFLIEYASNFLSLSVVFHSSVLTCDL